MDPNESSLPAVVSFLSWALLGLLGVVGIVVLAQTGELLTGVFWVASGLGSFIGLRALAFVLACLLDTRNAVVSLARTASTAGQQQHGGSEKPDPYERAAARARGESAPGRRYVVGPDGQVQTRED